LKGASPFLKSERSFEKRIHPSKRVNAFTLEGEFRRVKVEGDLPSKFTKKIVVKNSLY
jgi:hypothetical protein